MQCDWAHSARLTQQVNEMKRYLLLALAAASLFALAPGKLKANEFRVYVDPGYQQDGPYYYRHYGDSDEYYGHRWHGYHHYNYDPTTTTGIKIWM